MTDSSLISTVIQMKYFVGTIKNNSRHKITGLSKIGHFACERDFGPFRSHTYRSVFEPFSFSQKARCQTYTCRVENVLYTFDIESKASYKFDFEPFERN